MLIHKAPFLSAHRLRLRLSLSCSGLSLSLCLVSTPALAEGSAVVERRLASMGTVLKIRTEAPDRSAALAASEAAVREVERVEGLLSTWKSGGPLEALNRARPGERIELGRETANLLAQVEAWSDRTSGAFDPTILPLVRAWGLRGKGRIPSAVELRRALEATGSRRFAIDLEKEEGKRFSADAGIDEGAWAKGYALDAAVAALGKSGARAAVLDLGGQVFVVGRASVAIAHPRFRALPVASVSLWNASLSTSGNSERLRSVGGRRIGHLLDPHTGRPAPDFGSASAVAPSGLAADVLSTAFFVLGPEKGLALSEKLRREGFPNEALFLVIRGDRLEALASPGLSFQRKEPGP